MNIIMDRKIKRGENHFRTWYTEYKSYIDQLWIHFNDAMTNYIKEPLQYDYTDFVDFVYWHSSGIITRHEY